jgi:predicted TIM-barrel fold metal-dependent hydrolase
VSRQYRIVNVGSHVNPPARMWAEYFPKELRDRAPQRVVKDFDGNGEYEALILEGVAHRQLESQIGIKSDGQLVAEGGVPYARSFEGGLAGGHDPAERLKAMDLDHVDADVLVHPGYPILLPKDRQTRWGMMYAFNNWLADFCSHSPERLIGIGEVPLWDIDLAVQEARRIAARGLKGVLIPAVPGYYGAWSSPADAPYTDPRYRPLWKVLDELHMVLVIHADAAAATPGLQDYTNPGINMIINKTMAGEAIASLIVGNVFRDFPNLKLVCVETGVGWMAHLVSWMDVLVKEHPSMYRNLTELPSETFHRHVFGSFLWDTIGIHNKDVIGIDNMMWCNDFPHSYGPWPHSDKQIEKDMAGLSPDERRKILADNAVRVFQL